MYFRICHNYVKIGHPESNYLMKIIIYDDDFISKEEIDTYLPSLDFVRKVGRMMVWHYKTLGYKNFYDTMDEDADD